MICSLLAAIGIFLYAQNNWIGVTEYNTERKNFNDKVVFVHLSDIHGKYLGAKGWGIVSNIKKYKKIDGIFITGDLIDSRRYDEENAIKLINGLKDVAPIFYVIGNHEGRRMEMLSFLEKLENMGVIVLRNKGYELKLENECINILGIDDPSIRSKDKGKDEFIKDKYYEARNSVKNKNMNMLLTHRPEKFDLYVNLEVDFVFAGHAHGGQFRIPFLGGILAPSEGFFPKYAEGMHTKKNTTMIVSRGIGRSAFPFRIFNRPEIVVFKLN